MKKIILPFMVFMTCFTFPMFNFVKMYSKIILVVNLLLSLTAYYEMGVAEAKLFPKFSVWKILCLNLMVIGLGMICRYLLEFGEVSNTYNFVPLNIAFHAVVALSISIFMFWYHKNQKRNTE